MQIFKKEKRVVRLVTDHLQAVDDCLSLSRTLLEHYLRGELDEAKKLAQSVDDAESKADQIRAEIRDALYAGAYLPTIRGDIHGLVENIDRVANGAEDCCDFFMMQRPEIPAEMREAFDEIAHESFKIAKPLMKAVVIYFKPKGELADLHAQVKKVSDQESIVDTKEWDLARQIFRSSLDLSQKIHLKGALDHIVEVTDRAEDAAERLDLASLKSVL